MRAPVTSAQAAIVRAAQARAEQAQRDLSVIVSALAAGHVPDGCTLTAVEDDALVVDTSSPAWQTFSAPNGSGAARYLNVNLNGTAYRILCTTVA
jgi:hypothetical protein